MNLHVSLPTGGHPPQWPWHQRMWHGFSLVYNAVVRIHVAIEIYNLLLYPLQSELSNSVSLITNNIIWMAVAWSWIETSLCWQRFLLLKHSTHPGRTCASNLFFSERVVWVHFWNSYPIHIPTSCPTIISQTTSVEGISGELTHTHTATQRDGI